MIRKCDVCGLEADEYWMFPFNIGTRTKWLCWTCWKNAQREANLSDKHRHYKLYKIKKSKEREK